MDDLSEKFIEEANELLEILEASLLELENSPENEVKINEVFRVMHSLKGTGAMFGFDDLSSFTHDLESVYDLVRGNKLEISKDLLDTTFQSIDIIKSLLHPSDEEETLQRKDRFTEEIQKKFLNKPNGGLQNETANTGSNSGFKKPTQDKKKVKTYLIRFQPNEDIQINGTHPLYLIDELLDLGTGRAFLHTENLPAFEQIAPDYIYMKWEFLLATSESISSIQEVFIFVEDSSVLEISPIAEFDIFSNENIDSLIDSLRFDVSIDQEKIDKLLEGLKDEHADDDLNRETLLQGKTATTENQNNSDKKPAGVKNAALEMNTVRVSSKKLDRMLDLISEMITAQARLEHLSAELKDPELSLVTESYQKLSRRLRENTLEIRLIPIYSLVTRFKRLVRDLSDELGKKVRFVAKGTETELDKSIIEKLYDPLMHIIRNCIDHGIELPEARAEAQKPNAGLLELTVYYAGTNVVIEIKDDGTGIDLESVRKKAVEKSLILAGDVLDDKELMNLIFLPGLSTSETVSKVSGRGVGLDVVKKNISELRGELEVMSTPGQGTTFRILLPLTLSIIDGLLVQIGEMRCLIPIESISQIFELKGEELESNFNHLVVREERQIHYINLVEEFSKDQTGHQDGFLVVVKFDERETGFVVSSLLGKHQAVIKPLNKLIRGQEMFLGATVLGDGEVTLVLDAFKTIQKFFNN